MQFKFLAIAALSATVLATPEHQEKRQFNNIPSSLASVIATAVPSSLINAFLATPTARSAIVSSLLATPPAWYSALPDDAKSGLAGILGVTAAATGSASTAGAGASSGTAVPTKSGNSSVTTGGAKATGTTPNVAAGSNAIIGAGLAGIVGAVGLMVL